MPLHKIIISGGGTGGHIFPAIAIADEIKKRFPESEILFVGAKGKMEMTRVPDAGYKIEGLWISGIQRKLTLKNLTFPFKLISSLWKANSILRKFKPDVAIGVGGYASGPLLKRANANGIKTVLQEQNSFPGITNRWLAGKADEICVAYDGLERWFPPQKITQTGNPVRSLIREMKATKAESLSHFKFNPNKKTILAVGGSLGARTINQPLEGCAQELINKGFQNIWQCGKSYQERAYEIQKNFSDSLILTPFIKEMDLAYAAADIIISRAGAMSISELCLVGKPTILIPSPNVSEDHQTQNAKALSDQNAAILLKDSNAKSQLKTVLFDLAKNQDKLDTMSQNIKKLAKPNATEDIVNQIEKLTK